MAEKKQTPAQPKAAKRKPQEPRAASEAKAAPPEPREKGSPRNEAAAKAVPASSAPGSSAGTGGTGGTKPKPKPRLFSRDKQLATETRALSPKVPVVNAANETIREIQLSPAVFAVSPAAHLVYEAVKQHRAGARRGTHMTKNRALVSGSGKKPWRQKGTGRARVGEARNPLWRHGGTVFGPQPRDYSYAMPKKARVAALRAALSQRVTEGAVKVVEAFEVQEPKTKLLKGMLARLGIAGKAVVVDHQPADALVLSGRNLVGVKVVADSHLTAYDVLDCKHLVVTQEAIDKLEERLAPLVRE
jgi:large subunit ribosomal protein L4